MNLRRLPVFAPVLLLPLALPSCDRPSSQPSQLSVAPASASPAAEPPEPAPSNSTQPPKPDPEPRTLRFKWRPPGASARAYAMEETEDQHRIVLTRGVRSGGSYPALVALHGQPGRGQAPRDYAFPGTVENVTLGLVDARQIEPLILVIPVFRFEGKNWPAFDVAAFMAQVDRVLGAESITADRKLLVGHSAAAGCGGGGLNWVHEAHPAAVGFFDTCVGAGFMQEVRALRKQRVPTLIVHSVETAGFRPRPPVEYWPKFDFGRVYSPLGLEPVQECEAPLPDVPLRDQPYRCAADPDGIVRAFVVDTGEGQEGHDAVVPVALRFFLKQYAKANTEPG